MDRLKANKPQLLRKLSEVDKKLLKVLLSPGARMSSHALAKIIGLPRTTVQRRRTYLEKHFLEYRYSLRLDNLGYRRVDLFIYTGGERQSRSQRNCWSTMKWSTLEEALENIR